MVYKKYSYKHGKTGASAQTVGETLERIEARDGAVTKEAFLEESRPEDTPVKKALCSALAHQMRLLISDDDEDVDDIVSVEYQNLKVNNDDEAKVLIQTMQPLYPGDSIYMKSAMRPVYSVGIDEVFEHTWVFDNIGKQTWRGRRLFFSNHSEVRPRAEANYIDVPDTPPNKSVRITAKIDSRSFEGKTECIWIMVDEDGNNCFPGSSQFTIIVDATFQIGS